MAKRYLFVVLLLCGLMSCSNAPEKPDHLIPEQKYVNLIIEKQLLRTVSKNKKTDSTEIDSLRKAIYKKYSITNQQFMQSHHYYQQFPDEQKKRVDKAMDKLREELIMKKDSTEGSKTDSTTKSPEG